jgi:hypothetical protein
VILAGGAALIILHDIPKTMPISLVRAGVIIFCFLSLLILIPEISKAEKAQWLATGVIVITGFDLLANGFPLNPFAGSEIFKTGEIGNVTALTDPRVFLIPGDEYDLKFARFFRTHDFRPIENWDNLRQVNLPDFNSLSAIPYVNNFDPLVPAAFQSLMHQLENTDYATVVRWLRNLNVGIIEQMDINSPLGIKNQAIADSRFIHAYLCHEFKKMDEKAILPIEHLGISDPDHPFFTSETNGQVIANECVTDPGWMLESLLSSYSSITVDFTSENQSWIELALIWYPGWKAYLDGSPIHINNVNGILIGAQVTPGKHQLVMQYKPDSFKFGLAISSSTLIILVVFTVVVNRIRSKREAYEKTDE